MTSNILLLKVLTRCIT